MHMSDFKKNILKKVQKELEESGFKKSSLGLSYRFFGADLIGTISLGTGKGLRADELAIWPMIGARNLKIGRLVSDIRGQKFNKFYPLHACTNIGYLMPENKWKTFIFCEINPCEKTIRELLDSVERYAVPFMWRVAQLDELVKAIGVERISNPETRIYHIPAGLFLLGDLIGSKSFLDETLEMFSSRKNSASEKNFRLFAVGLRQEIENSQ